MSTEGRWHQFNINSDPQFGVQRRKFIQWVVIQHGCENWPWVEAARPFFRSIALLCSASCRSVLPCTHLLHSVLARHPLCFSSRRGNTGFRLQWKGKVCSQSQRGAGLYRQKFLPLAPDWFSLMQTRAQSSKSDWSKRSECSHSGWSVT